MKGKYLKSVIFLAFAVVDIILQMGHKLSCVDFAGFALLLIGGIENINFLRWTMKSKDHEAIPSPN